ncbi:Protein TIC 214, partial [Dissostichus eleginoides]
VLERRCSFFNSDLSDHTNKKPERKDEAKRLSSDMQTHKLRSAVSFTLTPVYEDSLRLCFLSHGAEPLFSFISHPLAHHSAVGNVKQDVTGPSCDTPSTFQTE